MDTNVARLQAAEDEKQRGMWEPGVGGPLQSLREWVRHGRGPIARYNHDGGSVGSVTGYIVRTAEIANTHGYIFADICLGRIRYYTLEELVAERGDLRVWGE